ncbi:hypothetical protein A3Q56_01848 [Intoshia linei]|uniref:ZU5 domain-containing protein n=1 Tax=Intoshia linei TaxID=1819745 RepID=A0A177B9U9_9BILA|nr:hypothetical protein A3Q56_01848 [Intoshia linei]
MSNLNSEPVPHQDFVMEKIFPTDEMNKDHDNGSWVSQTIDSHSTNDTNLSNLIYNSIVRPRKSRLTQNETLVRENHKCHDYNTRYLLAARIGNKDELLNILNNKLVQVDYQNSAGLTALHLASKEGYSELVKIILDRGANVNIYSNRGNGSIHLACLSGYLNVVKLLVETGAHVNGKSANGFTPIYMAAQENKYEIIKYLLAKGAKQNIYTNDGFSPLAVALQQKHSQSVSILLEDINLKQLPQVNCRLRAIHIAAKCNDVDILRVLLKDFDVDTVTKNGFTALHITAHYNSLNAAKLLITNLATIDFKARNGITPLHVSSRWGRSNIVDLLLTNHANHENVTKDGLTALHYSCRYGHLSVARLLIKSNVNIEPKSKSGLSPLHVSAQGDNEKCAKLIIMHGANVEGVCVDSLTPLHVAAHCNGYFVAKLLLQNKANVNCEALNGFTPLHIACKKNNVRFIKLLILYHAKINKSADSGLTPLHICAFMNNVESLAYILTCKVDINKKTNSGETSVHLCTRSNKIDSLKILIKNNADINGQADEGQTALHIAAKIGNLEIIDLLISYQIDTNTTTIDGHSALHVAARSNHAEIAVRLIENGANMMLQTKKGFNALHICAKYDSRDVAICLINKGIQKDIRCKYGLTALHVATHYDAQKVAVLLIDRGADINAKANNHYLPLHVAVRKNNADLVKLLLNCGAKVNGASKLGFTPLHISSLKGNVDICENLILHKARCNVTASNGITPLHLASQEDNISIASVLIMYDIDINSPTKAGYTPLHTACHFGAINMVRFLLDHGALVDAVTSLNYTSLHHAAQQNHVNVVSILLSYDASADITSRHGYKPINIAKSLKNWKIYKLLEPHTNLNENVEFASMDRRISDMSKYYPDDMIEKDFSDSDNEIELLEKSFGYLSNKETTEITNIRGLPKNYDTFENFDEKSESKDLNKMDAESVESGVFKTKNGDELDEPIYSNEMNQLFAENTDNADNDQDIFDKRLWTSFLSSFVVDSRGGSLRGCRKMGIRFIIPPKAVDEPTQFVCKLLSISEVRSVYKSLVLNEGEGLVSHIIKIISNKSSLHKIINLEVPHFAALRGNERELIVLRRNKDEKWSIHSTGKYSKIGIAENIDCSLISGKRVELSINSIDAISANAGSSVEMYGSCSKTVIQFTMKELPVYFAIISRTTIDNLAIGTNGGRLVSSCEENVFSLIFQNAISKTKAIGISTMKMPNLSEYELDKFSKMLSPIVSIEPRRRKFYKEININIPVPSVLLINDVAPKRVNLAYLRVMCSICGGNEPPQWTDMTDAITFSYENGCVQFSTIFSGRFWLVNLDEQYVDDNNLNSIDKISQTSLDFVNTIYDLVIRTPIIVKFYVYGKWLPDGNLCLRVMSSTDDGRDRVAEKNENYTLLAKSRPVEVDTGRKLFFNFEKLQIYNKVEATPEEVRKRSKLYSFHELKKLIYFKNSRDQIKPWADNINQFEIKNYFYIIPHPFRYSKLTTKFSKNEEMTTVNNINIDKNEDQSIFVNFNKSDLMKSNSNNVLSTLTIFKTLEDKKSIFSNNKQGFIYKANVCVLYFSLYNIKNENVKNNQCKDNCNISFVSKEEKFVNVLSDGLCRDIEISDKGSVSSIEEKVPLHFSNDYANVSKKHINVGIVDDIEAEIMDCLSDNFDNLNGNSESMNNFEFTENHINNDDSVKDECIVKENTSEGKGSNSFLSSYEDMNEIAETACFDNFALNLNNIEEDNQEDSKKFVLESINEEPSSNLESQNEQDFFSDKDIYNNVDYTDFKNNFEKQPENGKMDDPIEKVGVENVNTDEKFAAEIVSDIFKIQKKLDYKDDDDFNVPNNDDVNLASAHLISYEPGPIEIKSMERKVTDEYQVFKPNEPTIKKHLTEINHKISCTMDEQTMHNLSMDSVCTFQSMTSFASARSNFDTSAGEFFTADEYLSDLDTSVEKNGNINETRRDTITNINLTPTNSKNCDTFTNSDSFTEIKPKKREKFNLENGETGGQLVDVANLINDDEEGNYGNQKKCIGSFFVNVTGNECISRWTQTDFSFHQCTADFTYYSFYQFTNICNHIKLHNTLMMSFNKKNCHPINFFAQTHFCFFKSSHSLTCQCLNIHSEEPMDS